MSLHFVETFERLGRRLHRRRWAAAACWTLAGAIAAALVLVAADRWLGVFRWQARVGLTLLLVLAAAATWRWATSRIGSRLAPLDVALVLEKDQPELQSLLSSGVEFSGQDPSDATAGSEELRRAVVLRAGLASDQLDVRATVARRAPLRRAVCAAAAAVVAAGAATAWAPAGMAVGAARLVNPFNRVEWPREHDLAFVDAPAIVALGGDFHVQLRDRRGALPDKVVVEYRTRSQGRWRYDSQRYAPDGSSLDVTRPNVQGPFEFRAWGGDHLAMPWRGVATAPAPQVEEVRLTAHPPAYTGRRAQEIDEPFRVLEGSTLDLMARASQPIESAELSANGKNAVQLIVGEDRQTLSVPPGEWRPAASADWKIRLTTAAGLTVPAARILHIEVQPDEPPTVAVTDPVGDLSLLPTARIAFTVEALDDVGLSRVSLVWQKAGAAGSATPPGELELYQGSAQRKTTTHALDLAALAPKPSEVWEIIAVARDLAGHERVSQPPLRVRVITPEQFMQRAESQLARLRGALQQAYENQRAALSRVQGWSTDGSRLQWPGVDQALAALARQRQTAQPLVGDQDAAIPVIVELLADYDRNGLEGDEAVPRLRQLQNVLVELTEQPLPAAEELLAQFVRQVEQVDGRRSDVEALKALTEASQHQSHALAVLGDVVRDLGPWSEVQQYRRELTDLAADQTATLAHTEALARLALQENERASQAADRDSKAAEAVAAQRAVAGRLSDVLARMQRTRAAFAKTQPDGAVRLDAAIEAAGEAAVQALAFQAADHLAAARFGRAADVQRAVEDALEQILDQLSGSDSRAAANRAAELKRAEQRVESLRRQTSALAEKQEAAQAAPSYRQQQELAQAANERKQLAEAIAQLTASLNQISTPAAAKSAARAQQALSKANPSAAADRRAENELQKAKQALAEERQVQQALVAQLQMQQLESALQGLVADQQLIVDATQKLSAADAAEVAARQAAIRHRAERQRDRLAALPVFGQSLHSAADAMQRVEQELLAGPTGDPVVQSARLALERLTTLATSMRPQPPRPTAAPSGGSPPGGGGAPPQNQAQNAAQTRLLQLAIAQLSILRKMQADLEAQTQALEQKFAAGKLGEAELAQQAAALANQQRSLAELAESVVRDAQLPPIEQDDELP